VPTAESLFSFHPILLAALEAGTMLDLPFSVGISATEA